MNAPGAALCTALITASNSSKLFGGQANAPADHHAVIMLVGKLTLNRGGSGVGGADQAKVGLPSAFGHLPHGNRDARMDLLRTKAGRQRRIGEVDRFRFLAYEQNPRHFMLSV